MPDIYIYSRVYFNLNIIKKQIVNIYFLLPINIGEYEKKKVEIRLRLRPYKNLVKTKSWLLYYTYMRAIFFSLIK